MARLTREQVLDAPSREELARQEAERVRLVMLRRRVAVCRDRVEEAMKGLVEAEMALREEIERQSDDG